MSAAATVVLVVDDDPAIRRTLQLNLRARRYAVLTAGSGQAALLVCAEQPVDLVILDLGLPDLDGLTCSGGSATSATDR